MSRKVKKTLIFGILFLILLILIIGCAKEIEEKTEPQLTLPKETINVTPEEKSEELEKPSEEEAVKPPEPQLIIKEEPKKEENIVKLAIPKNIESNCIGFVPGAPEEAETISMIKAAWARPHPGPFAWGWIEKSKGNFNFEETDKWVKEAQKNNIAILATIWPYAEWDQKKCHDKNCEITAEDQFYPMLEGGIPKSRCAPCNFEDYKNFLLRLVERYDGDGVGDMPGLEIPIKYYEILNEPEMKESFLTFYKGTQEEYVEILKGSYGGIKSACPDCKVVQGGAAGIMDSMISYWRKIFELGGGNYFDIANIHYINNGDLGTLNVNNFKKLVQEKNINKPIWITEAEYTSENEVEKSVDGALNAGASKIFFTRFIVGHKGPPMPGEYSKVYDRMAEKCR